MEYIGRELERKFLKMNKVFKALLVTGARQVGKSTMLRHLAENYVVGELFRNVAYGETNVNMTYYRDTNQKEIDVVIEENGVIHPIEIKKATNPERKLVKAFNVLNVSSNELGKGLVICMTDRTFPIDENNYMIPASIL